MKTAAQHSFVQIGRSSGRGLWAGIVLIILMVMSMSAHAVSIYDVLQLSKAGYGDQRIIALIDTTQSTFVLNAEDIPRLKKLGVSEPVIQRMLQPRVISEEPAQNSSSTDGDGDQAMAPDATEKSAAVSASSSLFDAQPLAEQGAGGHQHAGVTLGGVTLMVLRDEAGYASVSSRAQAVASRLDQTARQHRGQFQAMSDDKPTPGVYFVDSADPPRLILKVLPNDAYAYAARSRRRVTPRILADYWAALLNDYSALSLQNQAPSRIAKPGKDDALQLLYRSLDKTHISVTADPQQLSQAVAQLPVTAQRRLDSLARSVPEGFEQ